VTTTLGIENPSITCAKSAPASQKKKIRRQYKIGQLAMFNGIIGVYRENSGRQEMGRGGGLKYFSMWWSD